MVIRFEKIVEIPYKAPVKKYGNAKEKSIDRFANGLERYLWFCIFEIGSRTMCKEKQ